MTNKTEFNAVPVGQFTHLRFEAQRLRAEAMVDALIAIWNGVSRLVSPLVRFGRWAAGRLARRQEIDRIYAELSRMSDRDLADIGIARGDIPAVAEGTWRREPADVVVLRPAADTEVVDLPRAA